jgi:hypothetical protein
VHTSKYIINLFAQTPRRWFSTLISFSKHIHRVQEYRRKGFPIKFIIKVVMASPLLFIKMLYKKPWIKLTVPTDLNHSQGTASTHIGARKINTPKITFLASTNEINAHKNKCSTSRAQHSPTPCLI